MLAQADTEVQNQGGQQTADKSERAALVLLVCLKYWNQFMEPWNLGSQDGHHENHRILAYFMSC